MFHSQEQAFWAGCFVTVVFFLINGLISEYYEKEIERLRKK
jgi:hypothetical protein